MRPPFTKSRFIGALSIASHQYSRARKTSNGRLDPVIGGAKAGKDEGLGTSHEGSCPCPITVAIFSLNHLVSTLTPVEQAVEAMRLVEEAWEHYQGLWADPTDRSWSQEAGVAAFDKMPNRQKHQHGMC